MTKEIKGQLGDLELEIMRILWEAKAPMQVNEVVKRMGQKKAYTTIMTTMSRLHQKGYLEQARTGRAYNYRPRVTRASVVQRVWGSFADILVGGDMIELIPHLLGKREKLTERERRFLKKMADRVEDKNKG